MASARELEGRRIPSYPGAKSDETQTFVGPDGNTIEVTKSIDKQALAILKKRGFKSQTRALREQEEAAIAKAEARDTTGSQDDETAGEEGDEGQSRTPTEGEDENSGPRRTSKRSR
ncbi:hypothetical protein SEA_NOSHOW_8 [Mycobacterium phage NoShow]|nr:hypothetical protein SEA_NOSHOW_8 [Mycobacterium phage NoShow]